MKLILVSSWTAAAMASRSAPIVMTLAMTISSTAGVAMRAPKVVRRTVARSVLVTLAALADVCWPATGFGVERNSGGFWAKAAVAPTVESLAIPAGGAAAAAVVPSGP